jgi:hypothetical protein
LSDHEAEGFWFVPSYLKKDKREISTVILALKIVANGIEEGGHLIRAILTSGSCTRGPPTPARLHPRGVG